MKSFVLSVLVAGGIVATAPADTLTLRDGTVVTGTYLGGNARDIRMDLGDKVQTFGISRVASLSFDGGDNQSYNAPPAHVDRAQNYPQNAPPPPQPQQPPYSSSNGNQQGVYGVSIPSGTTVTVRMVDAVDSDSSRLGATYRGSIDEPVIVDGQTVIPRGADVVTKVIEDKQSGKIEGRTVIGLALDSIMINGQMIPVSSQDVTQESGSRGARSGKVIGGTAALGAIIGGLAGGGRGAAIGAASGAAVGTGAQVATHGQRVHIPSETRLTFTLTNPINL